VPLVVINQVSPIFVAFSIPESRLPELKQYMKGGTLEVAARPPNDTSGPPSIGRIGFVDNAVDQNSGTIKIKGAFSNEDRRLWPGQFVNVVVTLTTDPGAIVVPSSAIQTGQQGSYVFVLNPNQTVDIRPVTVARLRGAESVISSGLKAGETIVSDGQLLLVPGSKVSVKNAANAKGAS
jgi:multidrug efflux system membrane fusion protein